MGLHIERFKKLKTSNNISYLKLQYLLSEKYNINKTIDALKAYVRTKNNANPPNDILLAFSEIFNVSTDYLLGLDEESQLKSVPIIGSASCGSLEIDVYDDKEVAYLPQNEWSSHLFAVHASGDSMATEIYDGDICIIDTMAKVQNGDMVYYKIDNECAIKVFYDDVDNNQFEFIPYNSSEFFKTKIVRKEDEDKLVYYKVIHTISNKKNNRAARLKMIRR